MKIAVAGKGGVGKTLIAAGLAVFLAREGYKTIAIDADPTPNLALSLGLPPREADAILPVSENEALIGSKTGTDFPGIYTLNFTVDDIVRDFSVATPAGVNLLVMGTVRSMGAGCTCAANSVIRTLLRYLIVERDEAIVLDMEAGLEHLGRGTAQHVETLLIVCDADAKSLHTAKTIAQITAESGIPRIMLVGNKISTGADKTVIRKFARAQDLHVAGYVPFDPEVVKAGIGGSSILILTGSPALRSIARIGRSIQKQDTANKSM